MSKIIMLILGIIFAAAYIYLYLANRVKYQKMVEGVDSDTYLLPDIFVVGISVIELLKINTSGKSAKTRAKYAELFGKQYVDFYCMISVASTISYVMLFLPIALFLGALSDQIIIAFLIIVVSALLPIYTNMNLDTKITEMRDEILLDYPNVLSRMALLINAGMVLRDAWKAVSESGSTKIYREMQNSAKLISNGYSELQAYEEMANNCKVNEIKKFVSIICQNMEKGSSELVQIMRELSVDAWNTKKNVAKMKGDSASAKLIIPIGISFIAILGMIMIPIVANMNLG